MNRVPKSIVSFLIALVLTFLLGWVVIFIVWIPVGMIIGSQGWLPSLWWIVAYLTLFGAVWWVIYKLMSRKSP
jgi:hypothetical protein